MDKEKLQSESSRLRFDIPAADLDHDHDDEDADEDEDDDDELSAPIAASDAEMGLSDGTAQDVPQDTVGPSMIPEDDIPSTPQAAPATLPSAPHSTDILAIQFSQLFEILSRQLRTMFGELR